MQVYQIILSWQKCEFSSNVWVLRGCLGTHLFILLGLVLEGPGLVLLGQGHQDELSLRAALIKLHELDEVDVRRRRLHVGGRRHGGGCGHRGRVRRHPQRRRRQVVHRGREGRRVPGVERPGRGDGGGLHGGLQFLGGRVSAGAARSQQRQQTSRRAAALLAASHFLWRAKCGLAQCESRREHATSAPMQIYFGDARRSRADTCGPNCHLQASRSNISDATDATCTNLKKGFDMELLYLFNLVGRLF
jgi:hypothetical protein